MTEPSDDIDRNDERGNLFVHTVLAEQAMRVNENEAMLNGLVDVLVQRQLIQPEELMKAVQSARTEAAETGQLATVGVAIRIDGDDAGKLYALVNCEHRLPVCKAVCCRLQFALSVEEIESGRMKWDLGRPYYNRRASDGYCHQIDREKLCCSVYWKRPSVCRKYSCAGDTRIWKDFEAMELNQEWIDANLGGEAPSLIDILMNASSVALKSDPRDAGPTAA
jgi:Fe-S-cluster containining protein